MTKLARNERIGRVVSVTTKGIVAVVIGGAVIVAAPEVAAAMSACSGAIAACAKAAGYAVTEAAYAEVTGVQTVFAIGGTAVAGGKRLLDEAVDAIDLSVRKAANSEALIAANTVDIGGNTCVYICVVDGVTRYVGITDDVMRRGAEHMSKTRIEIETIPGLSNLSRADARAVEQMLIHYYGLEKNNGTLLNKINSISPARDPTAYEQSLIRGKELLDSVDYKWAN
ncbi:hypothetical protein [Pararhizobium sp.]|uniref:hypothetical protein n=1 Tax=Pararhizobium sp. TaxID=1977563 RepID=UPI00271BA4A5|nr:hypothetical protein [Pararhizobium sp.]MDO9417159.1 hypothetical protein [Pararhizobium sp.]